MRRPRLVVAVLLAVLAVVARPAPAGAQDSVDAAALMGEWTGKWSQGGAHGHRSRGGGQGDLTLTITDVSGKRVKGRWEATSRGRGAHEGRVDGMLEGDHLTWGAGANRFEVVVAGKKMDGKRLGEGSNDWEFSLLKK